MQARLINALAGWLMIIPRTTIEVHWTSESESLTFFGPAVTRASPPFSKSDSLGWPRLPPAALPLRRASCDASIPADMSRRYPSFPSACCSHSNQRMISRKIESLAESMQFWQGFYSGLPNLCPCCKVSVQVSTTYAKVLKSSRTYAIVTRILIKLTSILYDAVVL